MTSNVKNNTKTDISDLDTLDLLKTESLDPIVRSTSE